MAERDDQSGAGVPDGESLAKMIFYVYLWNFLPALVTRIVQQVLYKLVPRLQPAPGETRRRQKHYVAVYALLLVAFIAYSFREVVRETPENCYAALQLTPTTFTPKALRTNYRALSLKYHPDKLDASQDADEAGRAFLHIQRSFNVLKDPILRNAYNRFGDGAFACSNCRTEREFVETVFVQSFAVFYLGVAVAMGLYNGLGLLSPRTIYWRFALLTGVAAAESFLTLRARDPAPWLLPSYILYEKIVFLRQIYVFGVMSMSHLVPLLWPATAADAPLTKALGDVRTLLDQGNMALVVALRHFCGPLVRDSTEKGRAAVRDQALDALALDLALKQPPVQRLLRERDEALRDGMLPTSGDVKAAEPAESGVRQRRRPNVP